MKNERDRVRTSLIVDNQDWKVGDYLRERIKSNANLSIVSAYFTIYAYEALRDVLDNVKGVRFLYGEPMGVGIMDPQDEQRRAFNLNVDAGIELSHVLIQKELAKACAEWINSKVDVKSITKQNFLHGKLYHIEDKGRDSALIGSSNFTRRGLGYGTTPNIELNIDTGSDVDRCSLLNWFNDLWSNTELTVDVKSDVIDALNRLGQPYSPKFVYYKTLFHIFQDWLSQQTERNEAIENVQLKDTEIWKALYDFQKDGTVNAINRLLRHNGCIIADSVGLGKTWTALAVIKFFELRNERVLVLCPKRIEANWHQYTALSNQINNPFQKDRFNYTVMAHTDLSRYDGRSGSIDLSNFNWSSYDFVVIDESHNFRNEGRDRCENGKLKRSRFNRLLEEVIKDGVRTKLLMLSATPVNVSLKDLRNQIYLMTEKRQDAFKETLGIGDTKEMFRMAQQKFRQWEEVRTSGQGADKQALIESFGGDFLTLLDAVTIARSRKHLYKFYSETTKIFGGFPERAKPENLYPVTDSFGELSYDDLHQKIETFHFSIYMPSNYAKDNTQFEKERRGSNFDQRDREKWLIGMMRINLLKRLESSVHAFRLTVKRIIERIEHIEQQIRLWENKKSSTTLLEISIDDDEEDDEFTVGRKRTYHLNTLDLHRWKIDIKEDKKTFVNIYDIARKVTSVRDLKLHQLKRILKNKVSNPSVDRTGQSNAKVLVFTTFGDTAHYLYDQLKDWVFEELRVHIGLITGSNEIRSTSGLTKFNDVLCSFAPKAQNRQGGGEEISILIATDCISEGQNLQDCDLVVNYDIHWNPVRLLQRFGRIDRLGSQNTVVKMINFWPTEKLDQYLRLQNRVEARMILADATATGTDDLLSEDIVKKELAFRDEQLKKLCHEVLDIEDVNDGITMSDFTLDDFLADLLQHVRENQRDLARAPLGIYAIVDANNDGQFVENDENPRPESGVIFCLRQTSEKMKNSANRIWPYFLVYVQNNGNVRYGYKDVKNCLSMFQKLSAGQSRVLLELENLFEKETKNGRNLEKYNNLLKNSLSDIDNTFRNAQLSNLFQRKDAILERYSPSFPNTLELVTWLIISDGANIDMISDSPTACK